MKIKTSELAGIPLDWAVAHAQDAGSALVLTFSRGHALILSDHTEDFDVGEHYQPRFNWAQGGPIIEREKIEVFIEDERWKAYSSRSLPQNFDGDTPLIAAMRCYVASMLGAEVDVPDELTQGEGK